MIHGDLRYTMHTLAYVEKYNQSIEGLKVLLGAKSLEPAWLVYF